MTTSNKRRWANGALLKMEQHSSTKAHKANENKSSGNVPVGPDGVGGNSPAASQPDGLEQLGAHGKGMPARCLRRGGLGRACARFASAYSRYSKANR